MHSIMLLVCFRGVATYCYFLKKNPYVNIQTLETVSMFWGMYMYVHQVRLAYNSYTRREALGRTWLSLLPAIIPLSACRSITLTSSRAGRVWRTWAWRSLPSTTSPTPSWPPCDVTTSWRISWWRTWGKTRRPCTDTSIRTPCLSTGTRQSSNSGRSLLVEQCWLFQRWGVVIRITVGSSMIIDYSTLNDYAVLQIVQVALRPIKHIWLRINIFFIRASKLYKVYTMDGCIRLTVAKASTNWSYQCASVRVGGALST